MNQILLQILGLLVTIPILLLIFFIPTLFGSGVANRFLGTNVASRNLKMALVGLASALVFFFLLSFSPDFLYNQVLLIVLCGLSLFLLISMLAYLPNKLRSGNCLLNIGYTNRHKFLMVVGSVMIALMAYAVIITYNNSDAKNVNLFETATTTLSFFMGLYILMQGLTPLQIREHGILWLDLTTWEHIINYHWEQDQQTTLTLTRKRLFGIPEKTSFSIPMIHKDEVEKILSQSISNTKAG